jgi:hypothetical protein
MKDPEDEAFEELAMRQGHWQHTSGWRKKQIMEQAFPNPHRTDMTGMTLREYAAIRLKVPDSGIDWLDEMIRQSLRNDFAARAMQGLVIHKSFVDLYSAGATAVAQQAYLVADAMLKAREA